MKYIQLTQDKQAIVDDEDFEILSQFKWYYSTGGYAVRNSKTNWRNGKRYMIWMHKEILNFPNKQTDHINGNTLDNRKENLRICTTMQNQHNTKIRKNKNSQYKGVSFHKASGKWQVRIRVNKKLIHLGIHLSDIAAAEIYNLNAKKYFGEYARLNAL